MKHPDSGMEDPVGNGTYVVQMNLKKPIPQFMPISGRKIRIYYNGIKRDLNGEIKLDWLNLSSKAFKLKAKSIYLTN